MHRSPFFTATRRMFSLFFQNSLKRKEGTLIDQNETKKASEAFSNFFTVIKRLTEDDGCPWDKVQTPLSMRQSLVEETFEAIDAIHSNDSNHAKEELGDVLLNVLMIAYMYEKNGCFTVSDCINEVAEKIVRRHPHVFPQSEGAACMDKAPESPDEVLNQWDKIKRDVENRGEEKTILDEVPKGFPPLLKAYKMQKKAAKKGFDWKSCEPVLEKIMEELAEIKEARLNLEKIQNAEKKGGRTEKAFEVSSSAALNKAQIDLEGEVGDVLFAIVNYARHLGVNPENALIRTNEKFYRRFSFVEQKMRDNNIPMDNAHLSEQNAFWDEAKLQGK